MLLVVCLSAGSLRAQTPAPQGASKNRSPEFTPISKKGCAVAVALGEALAYTTIFLTLAQLNQTSPPELPKTLQVKLCAYCDICVSNKCAKLERPADGRRLLRQMIRNSLGQLGGALSSRLSPKSADQSTEAPVFALNTSLNDIGADGRFVESPNTIDFFDANSTDIPFRLDIDAGLPDGFYEPQDMALSEDGNTLVVVSRGSDPAFFPNGPPPHLTIVDVPTRRVTRRIELDPIDFPSHLVLSPDGSRAYVSSPLKQNGQFIDGAAIVEVDLEAGRIARRLDLPFDTSGSGEIVITPDGSQLVVILNERSSALPKLAVVDALTLTISRVYPDESTEFFMSRRMASTGITELAMDPAGSRVYISDVRVLREPTDQTLGIAVFDLATAEVTQIFPIPGKQDGGFDDLQVFLDGLVMVATDARTGTVFGIDSTTGEVRFVDKIADTFFNSEILENQ